MAVEASNTLDIASIDKSGLPESESPEDEDEAERLWNNIDDNCERACHYAPWPEQGILRRLYPICIGDCINHSGTRYQIVHRLGQGPSSVVWLAHDLNRNASVAVKVMVAGSEGEKEFENQKMLREAGDLEKSRLTVYLDAFQLVSPYEETGNDGPPLTLHRVLVLPLAGPALDSLGPDLDSHGTIGRIWMYRSIRSRMTAAKSLLKALCDLHKAGFVHGDLSLENVLWKVDPSFLQEITDNPDQAFGGPPFRWMLSGGEGLKAGHRVAPAVFPLHRLDDEVVLSDFGLLLRADNTETEDKLRGTPESIAPEFYHGKNPSQASDLWGFMVVFVYLYLGHHAFPVPYDMRDPIGQIHRIRDHLGPLPAEWATPKYVRLKGNMYNSPTEPNPAEPSASTFASRLSENRQREVESILRSYKDKAAAHGGRDNMDMVGRLEQEVKVKDEAEPHALEVIHSIFRYQPERRLTAEQLLVNPHWVRLMQICGVQDG